MELSNRELALLIWVVPFVLVVIRLAPGSVASLVRALLQPKVILPILTLAAYTGALVIIGAWVGIWESALLSETILWWIAIGVGLLFGVVTRSAEDRFFRETALRLAKLTVVVEAFISLYVFSFGVELLLLPALAFMGGMSAVADSRDDFSQVKHLIDFLLGLIAMVLISFSAVQLALDWNTTDKGLLLRTLGLPVWLTLGLIPYLYVIGAWAAYEGAFVGIDREAKDRATRRRAKLGLVLALHFRASRAIAFRNYWVRQIAKSGSLLEARGVGREYLDDRERRALEARQAEARLRHYAGVDGVDENGERLDQREFADTKEALERLAMMQMGWYRRGSRYRSDLLEMLNTEGLPEAHGIKLYVAFDGQSWWAWRRTVTGWCFAIGAAEEPPDQWLYDGPDPPTGFPGTDPAWGERWGVDAKNW